MEHVTKTVDRGWNYMNEVLYQMFLVQNAC